MATIQYTPPPTVKDFIKHYTPGELFLDWIVGPVGSGKTTGIFFKLCYMAQQQERSPIDGIRRTRCVIVRNTAPQLTDTTIKSFNYWFKDGQAGKWKATVKDFILRYGDVECEVMFRPLDTPDDVDRVLSLEVTFAIVDEFVQLPRALIEALSARCGRYPPEIEGGATNWGMWGASNPGNEADWWYPMLEDQGLIPEGDEVPTNWTYFKQPSGFADGSEQYQGLIAENTSNLPGKELYYTNLQKGKTKHWIKQFIEVQWGYSLAGKPVFSVFNPDFHVAKMHLRPLRGHDMIIGYDPGLTGSGWVLMQADESIGAVRVLREIVLEDFATDRAIKEKLKPMLARDYPGFKVKVVPDPSSINRSAGQQDSSVMKELRKHFDVASGVDNADNSITSRLEPAQYYMMRLTGEGAALIIDPRCVKLIRALAGGYKYSVSKTGDVTKDIPDKNIHSHVADAFTYGVRHIYRAEQRAAGRATRPVIRQRPAHNNYNMK